MGSLGPTVLPTTRASPRVLVVFDYDCSLVNDDSDALFCKTFCPELLDRLVTPPFTPPPHGWPALMDSVITECFAKNPHLTRSDVAQALAKIAVFPEMLDAVRLAADEYGATVVIISDGNTFFIESMLQHHGLCHRIAEVHTNAGVWEPKDQEPARLRVYPYHSPDQEPHGCPLCPSNLCKGRVLDALRAKTAYNAVLYVGDGIGDFCPSTKLTGRDTIFARANGADGKSFGLLHHLQEHRDSIQARIVEWSSGSDVYTQFRDTLATMSASGV